MTSKGNSGSPDYTYTGSGTNSQGNHYCSRDYGSAGTASGYHYSNNDGSYYYKNSNGSTYYDNGNGFSQFTTPRGDIHRSQK